MLEPQNKPAIDPKTARPVVTRLDEVAAQIADDAPSRAPEVVFVNATEPPESSASVPMLDPIREQIDTQQNLDIVENLARRIADIEGMSHYQEIQSSNQPTSCFAVDPFSMSVDGEVPSMPSIPIVDTMTRKILARKSDGRRHGWRLMPPEAEPQDLPCQESEAGSDTTELLNGNKDCFFAEPGAVVFVDGNLGFDHIDLSVYSIDNATFQPYAILLFVDADAIAKHDPDVSPQPITIRHRGIEYAIFKGGVVVDL